MDTSLRLPAADIPALQPTRLPSRQSGGEAQADPVAPEAGPAVQVSISEQGRAAARLEAPAVSGIPADATVATPVSEPSAVAAAAQAVSAVATPGPAADPARVQQAQAASAETRGVANVEASSADRPDAATAASSPSVQLYLENASRPSTQPGPSSVRISA